MDELPNPGALLGFVYKITNLKTGQIYIGKKNFLFKRKKTLLKKEISSDKRKKTYRTVVTESDWKTYYGSNTLLQKDVVELGEQFFYREILELSCSAKYLNYLELKYHILNDVLNTNSYNGNIAGKYYARDMESKCF